VNTEGGIYQWVNGAFQNLPGEATDIGLGGDFDSAWVTGEHGGIFYLSRAKNWVTVPGDAFRISVGPDGKPWVVTLQRTIYRWVNDKFELMPGRANDIGIGADGTVWVIGYTMTTDSSSAQRSAPQNPPIILHRIPGLSIHVPVDTPVPDAKSGRLICRGSRDPNDFNIQRSSGSKPGYTKFVIGFAYMDAAPGDKMLPGSCLFANRNYQQNDSNRQGDPQYLIEEIPDDTDPIAADYLKSQYHYWMFDVIHYVTPKGEHYFKAVSSRQTGAIVKID
jgi:hypothetical protein